MWLLAINPKQQLMDPKHLEHELKNYKLREATLEKRSKFLKEWRERWVVITQNYLFTFKSPTELVEPTDILDLRQIKSIKSYVKKYEDREMSTFKLSSEDASMYFRCKTVPQKWSWVVFFERLLEHKNNGSTNYNDYDAIRKGGFPSVEEFEKRGGSPLKTETKGAPGYDLGKVLKAEEQKQSEASSAEFQARKAEEQARRAQQARKAAQQARRAQQQRRIEEARRLEQQARRRKEQDARRREQQEKKLASQKQSHQSGVNIDPTSKKVSELKNMFQKKIEENTAGKFLLSHSTIPAEKWAKKQEKSGESSEETTNRRNTIVNQMFNQFKMKNIDSFKYIAEFLVEVTADPKTGFAPYVIHQSKHSNFKSTFAEIFIEHYTENPSEEDIRAMLGFLYIVYYESPGLFNAEQAKHVKKCLVKFLETVKNQKVLAQTLKTIMMVHSTSTFDLEEIRKKTNIVRDLEKASKFDDVIGIARKMKETFGLVY